jgi:hypothetical protein
VEQGDVDVYWDLTVEQTHNYVTVDGCIHHNSTKSTACIMELLRRAAEQKPSADGIRRTRMAIVRNTLPQLKSTCLVSIQQLLRPIARFKVSDNMIQIRMGDIESDWLLLPLDTPENIQRLLSLELTYGWVSEFREIEPEIVDNVLSRCGRFPSVAVGGPSHYGVIMETNSFSEDSEWYPRLELDLPSNWHYTVQPGARDPAADWLQYLPPDYYLDQVESNPDAWVEQYVDNIIGPSLSGQAVFARSFVHDFHQAEGELSPDYSRALVVGLDTGRNPAAVVGQLDSRGRMLVLGSCFQENAGMELFIAETLRPFLTKRFPVGGRFFIAIDPAARQRSQIGEESVLEAVRRLGFSVVLAPTNNLGPRLRAVERYMGLAISGGAGFLIDRVWNPDLIRAIKHDYKYKRDRKGALNEIPEKDHPASDLCFIESTPVLTPDGYVPIGSVCAGDVVVTPSGLRTVQAAMSRITDELIDVELSNGLTLTCTPDHPFIMRDLCIVRADALQYSQVLYSVGDVEWLDTIASGLEDYDSSNTTGKNTSSLSQVESLSRCTDTSGSGITGQSQKAVLSTTKTTTPKTTPSKILSWWIAQPTSPTICGNGSLKAQLQDFLTTHANEPLSGMPAQKEDDGILSMQSELGRVEKYTPTTVPIAGKNTKSKKALEKKDIALPAVKAEQGKNPASTTLTQPVPSAEAHSEHGGMGQQKHALSVVKTSRCYAPARPTAVVSLQVAGDPVYFVADALVHNCDALQYLCLSAGSNAVAQALHQRQITATPAPPAAGWT